MNEHILAQYGLNAAQCEVTTISGGLINATWKVTSPSGSFILQRINTRIFTAPDKISKNLQLLARHAENIPGYLFTAPLKTVGGRSDIHNEKECYRLFKFIENSHTIHRVTTAEEAYEAAKQFGKFTTVFSTIDTNALEITLPGFHDLTMRQRQFENSIQQGNQDRIKSSQLLIDGVHKFQHILTEYIAITNNPAFKKRVTHHDTKISNVLFDNNDHGLAVIDLDTVMPGFFISDVGDMMRTYLSDTTEEDSDYEKISVNMDRFKAIAEGYLEDMRTVLSPAEIRAFTYSGSFLTYMQILRFLSDYFNNDQYYTIHYEEQNLVRATNQFTLLKRLEEKRPDFERMISRQFLH